MVMVINFSSQGLYQWDILSIQEFKTWCYTFCGLFRCECYGHALTYHNVEGTGGQLGKCVCDCHPSANTDGENVCGSTLDNNNLF